MFCPNLSDPKIKEQFTRLENLHPDFAYYLWDKYEGEVPAKYYQLSSNQFQLKDSKSTDVEKNVKELDNFLINFVSNFGVKSEEVKSLQERFGVDALGVTDLINKLILFTEDRQIDTVPEEVAHVAVMMMGKSHPAIFELRGKIQDWSEYQKIKDQYLPIYKNESQVEIEAVGKLISQAIVNNYKVVGIQPNVLKKAFLAIKEFIKDLFSNTIFVSEKNRLNSIADEIALNILKGNYNYVSNAKPSGRKLNYFEALSENPFAKNIIDTFTDSGAKLTGSLALAVQGDVVYRPVQEPIHDLDFTVYSKSTFDRIKRKLDSVNAIPMHFGWESENRDNICYTYLVPAKGFKITNVTRNYLDPSQRVGSFDLVDESGNIVTPTAQNIMPVDFFFEENVEKENKLKNKFFKPSQDIYAGKLSLSSFGKHERMFNRAKDQKDYILSRPTEYSKPSEAFVYYQLPSTQTKPGVEELFNENPELGSIGTPQQYSAYLDTIFPNSKIEYRGDSPNLTEFFYSEPSEAKKKQGIAHKIGPGVYTSPDLNKADNFAKDNKGQVYTVLVNTNNSLVYNTNLDFLSAVAEYYNLGDVTPKEDVRDQFVREQAALGKSITVLEFNETASPVANTLALGTKKDIEGFKKFVSSQESPSIMDSRSNVSEKVLSKYFQQEKVKELVNELMFDGEYALTPREQKSKYIQRVIFNKEIRPLEDRASVEIIDNYRVILTPTEKTYRASEENSAYENFKGYAYSIANNVNKTYAFTFEPIIAKLEERADGKFELNLQVNSHYYDKLIDFIGRARTETVDAEIEAMTLLEKATRHQEYLDLMRESNTITVDGDVLPFDGTLYDSRIATGVLVNNAEFEKIGKVLNFLGSKFKGTSWSFNPYLDKIAQVNLVTGEIQFNPVLMSSETPWHEFGHIVVRNIRQNNPELFEELKAEVQRIHDSNPISSSYAIVESLYPEYGKSDSFWEEVITTELGRQADVEYRTRDEKTIWQKVFDFFKNLFGFNITESTKMGDLVNNLLSKEEIEFINSEYSTELEETMFARFTQGMKEDMLKKAVELVPGEEYEYASFANKIDTFASQILDKDIRGIIATTKNIRSEQTLLKESIKSLERIKSLITAKDVAEAYYELATYLQTSNNHLRSIAQRLRDNAANDEVPNSIKLQALHSANKQALAFEGQIDIIINMLSPKSKEAIKSINEKQNQERSQNVVLYNLASIKNTINIIKEEYSDGVLEPLAKELYSSISTGTEQLLKDYQKTIDTIDKSNVSDAVKKQRKADVQKKINELPKSEKDIIKLLSENRPESFAAVGFLDSAFLTNNPTINIISTYIKEGIYDQIPNVQKMNNKLQKIQEAIGKEMGADISAVIDRRKMYSFLYREVDYKYVEEGELKTKKVLALNGKTKNVELQNRITELKYQLEKAETLEERTRVNNEIDTFYEKYTERPFTEAYYEVSNSLPLEIRRERNEIYNKINALRNTLGTGNFDGNFHSDYEVVEMIKDLQMQLDDMERLYDYKGNKKTGESLRIAQAIIDWKKDKRTKNLVSYKLTDQSQLAFETEYKRQLDIYQTNLAKAGTNQEQKLAAQESFDAWRSINVRTTYKQEFYDRREAVLSKIGKLLASRGDLSKYYEELFNVLKGQRDSSGVYVPSNYSKELLAKSKEIEQQIEEVKAILKKDSKIDAETKAKLIPLFKELDDLQSTVNSSYYTQTKESILNELRSEIASSNPNITDEELNRLTHQKYISSDWYKDNHIIKYRWDDSSQSMVTKFEPIFVWRVTRPNNEEYVEQNQPGFAWYKSVVNPEFHNPNYKQGQIQFKEQTTGEYFNNSYNNLTDNQKKIVEDLRAVHYENQKGLYAQDKLGDIIPGVKKSGRDRFIDFVAYKKNPFNNFYDRIVNWFQAKSQQDADIEEGYGERTEEFEMTNYGKDSTTRARKLFMRYSTPLDVKDQSYDIIGAIANYGGASYQFKALKNIQATVLAANEKVQDLKSREWLENITNKILYGQSIKGNDKISKGLNGIGRIATSFAGRKSLGYNVLSIPQNLVTGLKQNLINITSHGLTLNSLHKGIVDATSASKDFFLYHGQLGAKPYSLQLLDYFATEQQNYFNRGFNVTNTGIRKYGNVLNSINTVREFTEFEIAAQTGFAYLNQYRIKLKDSDNTIPLKDAFEIKDGVFQLKPNVEENPELISFVRNRIYVAQRRAQGIYDQMSQPEADRTALGKLALFLKKWVVGDIKSIYGTSTIHYGAGLETEGSWSSYIQLFKDTVKYRNPIFAYQTATEAVKGGAKKGALNFAIWVALVNLLSALRSLTDCEEDNDADWSDYVCYFLKRIINEVEGGFTLWGLNETIYTYYEEQSNGVTLADKLFGAISGPISIIGRYFSSIDSYGSLDPYYRYTKSKVDWDKTHPYLAGKPALAVGAIEYFGLRGLAIYPKSMQFNNRRFEDYMPKTYGKPLKKKFVEDYELEDIKTRTPKARTKAAFKKQYKELKEKRKQRLNVGLDTDEIDNKISILRENYANRLRKIENETQDESSFLFIPTPFFSDKLELNKEIDEEDLE